MLFLWVNYVDIVRVLVKLPRDLYFRERICTSYSTAPLYIQKLLFSFLLSLFYILTKRAVRVALENTIRDVKAVEI